MSATYEPGTIAIATVCGVPNVRIVRTASRRDLWFSAESHGPYRDGVDSIKWHEAPTQVTDIRPLVVLDPSEFIAENLVPLLRATAEKGTEGLYARRSAVRFVADQIESQTRPPKPAEPTDLGAQVRDRDGEMWVRNVQGAWINLHGRYGLDPARTWDGLCEKYGPIEVAS